jgi:hypothetical protein
MGGGLEDGKLLSTTTIKISKTVCCALLEDPEAIQTVLVCGCQRERDAMLSKAAPSITRLVTYLFWQQSYDR